MSEETLTLQVGGTLNPRKHIYIERPEDARLLSLLEQGQFCNVLSPRQMGKSSLMARTVYRLRESGVKTVSIDLAGDLGAPDDPQDWYLDLTSKAARDLELDLDVECWWRNQAAKTTSQRLMRFFGEELPRRAAAPLVMFFDEIDSTLRLPYADDLFLSIRTLNNDRALVPTYEKVTFCLLGVVTPNELIKRREATAYNVGQTLELRDFDEERDDLSPLRRYLASQEDVGRGLLRRVLYWTGGHPYLTARLCQQIVEAGVSDVAGVDEFTHRMLSDWQRLGAEVHFQQVERFIGTRVSDKSLTLRLYEKIRERELDDGTQAHIELRLSGLVKRGEDGTLVVRNRIYDRVFDRAWAEKLMPTEKVEPAYNAFARDVRRAALPAYALAAILLIVAGIAGFQWGALSQQLREVNSPNRIFSASIGVPSQTRGTPSAETITVPKGIETLVIDLEVLEDSATSSYRVRLSAEDGRLLWQSGELKLDPAGQISLAFPRGSLPAGTYQMTVEGIAEGGTTRLVEKFSLEVVYSDSPASSPLR